MPRPRSIGFVLLVLVGILVVVVAVSATGAARRRTTSRQALPATKGAATRIEGPLVPSHGALLGAFVSATGTGWTTGDVTDREALVGRHFDIDHRFQNWDVAFPTPADQWDVDHGRIPMITWQPDSASLDTIAAGGADAVIDARARAVAAFGHPLFLRFAHEMNADWYPWSGARASTPGTHDAPAKYVAAWRHVHDRFVAAGATNAVWVWNPNRASIPRAAWNAALRYYPGDDYVDWVGIDGYNRSRTHAQSFTSIVTPLYDVFAARKPIMIGETASVEGPDAAGKAAWISAARTAITTRLPAVAALVWFDTEKQGFDWRVDSSPSALDAFRALAADPYFRTR
ncbi:MAG: glycoside hydrolase family 26 protein [Acidimicrobiia bacterium]